MTDFDSFWAKFPRRVGKLAAQKAYDKARRIASAEDILAGVERYIVNKPDYADWCHAQTFLAQGRWMDEPDVPIVKPDMRGHLPPCQSNTDCIRKVINDGRAQAGKPLWTVNE